MSLVSIIMPAYNAEKYIYEAISSVILQSSDQWELLVINDGSTDDTEKIVLSFEDNRIRYFKQANKGVAVARNLGLRNIRGDFFCFLDSDDMLPPGSLLFRLNVFNSNPTLSFVDGAVVTMDAKLERVKRMWVPNFNGNPLNDLVLLTGNSFFGLSWMIKRKDKVVYKMREGLSHSEDLLFFMELSRFGGLYGHTNEVILRYRNRPDSAMKNLTGLQKGYQEVFKIIRTWSEVDDLYLSHFRRRTKRIMVRSYIRTGQIKKAFFLFFSD